MTFFNQLFRAKISAEEAYTSLEEAVANAESAKDADSASLALEALEAAAIAADEAFQRGVAHAFK